LSAKKINLMISIDGMHHGGAERVVEAMCRNLDSEKFSVTVCWRAACGAIGEDLKGQGYDIIGLPERYPGLSPYSRFVSLSRLLKEKQTDILHTHDTGALVDGAQCKLLGSRARLVHTYHFGNYPNLRKRYVFLETAFSRVADKLVAVGYEQAVKICSTLRFPADRLQVIYNGVEPPSRGTQGNIVDEFRKAGNCPLIIGSISTLTEQKGLTYLLDSVRILKSRGVHCLVLIAGDGPLRAPLERKCADLHLGDMVGFLGWVPNAASSMLSALDVFCQPSLWEANSIVLLEAMAAGIPTVTTDVGESKHVVDQGRNGLIVESKNPVALADALESLLADEQLRQRMSEQAKLEFGSKYTVDKMVSKYADVFQSLV